MKPLWRPDQERLEHSQMTLFQKWIEDKYQRDFENYDEFHKFSVESSDEFWSSLFEYFSISYTGELSPVCEDYGFSKYAWFPHVKLNFAENLLRHHKSESPALHFIHESGQQRKTSYKDLYQDVAALQGA